MSALISTDALACKLGEPCLRIVNASWHMPAENRDAKAEHMAAHIAGAVFFDIDAVSDTSNPYPHMLPTTKDFEKNVSALGIGNNDEIVVYDSTGLFSAARVWWMFRVFGHDNVKVLDGGLPKWKAEGRALESTSANTTSATFHAHYRPELLRSKQQVQQNITAKSELLLDARSPGRFAGSEPEPRAGLRCGHIEGSMNVFFKECIQPPFNTLKSANELLALFKDTGINPAHTIAATCGSGVTACILALALFELGNEEVAIYDGAWAEWGAS